MSNADIETLYKKYGFLIYRRCLNILRDQAAAKDAMQEVFLKLIHNYHKIRNSEAVIAWIFNTARNHCFNLLRYNRKFAGDVDWDRIRDREDFEAALSARQALALVLNIKNRKIRDAVHCTYIEKMGQAEIQKVTGQSPATVRRNLARFREHVIKLKDKLG